MDENLQINLLNLSSGESKLLTQPDTEDQWHFGIAWSPDGRRIAFTGAGTDGRSDVYVVSVATKSLTKISHDGRSYAPSWSGDESYTALLSNRNGTDDIIIVDAAALNTAHVCEYEGRKSRPLWAVDNTPLYSTVEAGKTTLLRRHPRTFYTDGCELGRMTFSHNIKTGAR